MLLAGAEDIAAIAALRARWTAAQADKAFLGIRRQHVRPRGPANRGTGSALLGAIIAESEARDYARLILSPTERAVPFYRRAGFVVPDDAAGDDRVLVRPPTRPARGAAGQSGVARCDAG